MDEQPELWATVRGFPNYQVSSLGRIFNAKTEHMMSVSPNNFGHTRITLSSEWDGQRYTRSVAKIVAEAFVERSTPLCTEVIVLDGDYTRIVPENLAWRPARFAWKYARQLKGATPQHYRVGRVRNMMTGIIYSNVIEAGMSEGLLFEDITKSILTGKHTFPHNEVFENV